MHRSVKEYGLIKAIGLGLMALFCFCTLTIFLRTETHAATLDYTVNSVWVETDGTTPITPEDDLSATVYIKRDGTETGEQIVLSQVNNWSAITAVEYVEGAQYGIARIEVEGYSYSTSTEIVDNSFVTTVTFKKKSSGQTSTTSLTVQGKFLQEDGETVFTPDNDTEVPFHILKNGTEVVSGVLKASNSWTMTVTSLPVGDGIQYSVTEDTPDGYTMVSIKTTDGVTTITNQMKASGFFSMPVSVLWYDVDGSELTVPPVDSIKVYLLENDQKTGDLLQLTSPTWSGNFTNLERKSGVTYGVTVDPQTGYNSTIAAGEEGSIAEGYTISLKKKNAGGDDTIEIPVMIEWQDTDGNVYTPTDELSVDVYLLKDSVSTGDVVTLNNENDWSSSFLNITLTSGSTYFVEENVPDGYTMTYRGAVTEGKVADGYRIINRKNSSGSSSASIKARLLTAKADQTITLIAPNTSESAAFQWQYNRDGGESWKNCVGESSATASYVFSMQPSMTGRKYRCRIMDGDQITYTRPYIVMCVRSDDPYEEDVLYLSEGLTEIYQEAFTGIAAYTVVIPESVTTIGGSAFADCSELRYVDFQGDVITVASNAFERSSVIFICDEDSDAAIYAAENDIPFVTR